MSLLLAYCLSKLPRLPSVLFNVPWEQGNPSFDTCEPMVNWLKLLGKLSRLRVSQITRPVFRPPVA